MTFECVSCGAEVRFGASECRSCELGYRYLDGIAVPELAHPEPEQLGEAVEQEAGTHVQPPSASLVATTIVAVLSSSVLAVTSIALSPILEVVTKLRGSSASPGQAFLITALNVGAGLTTFGATFAAATLFLFWMHSTNRCLRSLGVGSLRFTPGWC
ncbi:MAG TPA: hypothetical protein VGK73_18395, partial [Polyangiaceae bacterium]